jgi:hypothetical protein
MLIENSAIDCNYLNKNNVFLNFNGLLSNNLIVYYMYYILNLKLRLTFLFLPSSNQSISSINSIDKIFKNAN